MQSDMDATELNMRSPSGTSSPASEDLSKKSYHIRIARCLLAEFIGDIIFIFIGSLQAASNAGVLGAALAHGITIAVLIMGMGHISGGHFNPAVTLGVFVSGNIHVLHAVFYILAQLAGGFVGSLFVKAVATDSLYDDVLKGGVTVPPSQLTDGTIYPMQVIVCEIIMTYLLVSSVLLTAVDTDSNVLAPLAIGLSITVDILAGAAISGASMNPARSLGPAIGFSIFGPSSSDHWKYHYVYWVGPVIGAVVAGVIYKYSIICKYKFLK